MASFRALILPAALAVATTAAAQTAPAPRLEIDGAFSSSARQTLNFDAARSAGFEAGVNLFPWRHAGLRVLFDRAKADVSGVNGPYDLSLQYVTIQPPDTTPRPFSYQRVLNADEIAFAETLDDIAAHFAPGPAHATVAAWRLVVAIKIAR